MSSALEKIKKYRNENNIATTSEYSNLTPLDKIEKYRSEHPYTELTDTNKVKDTISNTARNILANPDEQQQLITNALSVAKKAHDIRKFVSNSISEEKEPNVFQKALGTVSGGAQLLGQGVLKGAEGLLVDIPTQLASGALNLVGQKEKAQGLSEFANWDLTNMLINAAAGEETNPYLNQNQNLYNKNTLNKNSYITDENFAGKLILGVGEMLPTIAIGGAAGKAALRAGKTATQAAKAATIAGNVALGGKAYASGYNEAFSESGDIGKSTVYGLLNAGTEILTEKISDGIPGLKQVKGTTKKEIAKNYVKSMLGEGVEEVVGSLVNPLTQTVYKGSDSLTQYGTSDFWGEVLESGLLGAAIGGTLEGTNVARALTSAKPNTTSTTYTPSTTTEKSETNVDKQELTSKELTVKPEVTQEIKPTPVEPETKVESPNIETTPTKTINVDNGKITDSTGKEITFNRLHPDYQNITDDFNYNNSNYSHNTGFGLTFTDDESYTGGKPEKDVLRSTINTKGMLSSESDVKIDNSKIDELNKIIQDKNLDIPDAFTYGDTEAALIDKINMASNMVAENVDNNAGREVYKQLYDAIGKDGYIITNPNGSHTLSVISRNNINALRDTQQATTEKVKPTKATKEDIAHLFGEDEGKTETKKELPKKQETTKKTTAKKEVTPTIKVTPTELTESFSKIEESYKNANKYTGEIKSSLLKDLQKQYNEYRAKGGDKLISSLEEGYNTKQALEKVVLNKEFDDNKFTPAQANTAHMMMSSDNRIRQVERQIASKSAKSAKEAEVARILEEYDSKVAKGMDTIDYYENLKKQYNVHQSTKDVPTPKEKEIFTPTVNEAIQDIDEGTKALDNTSVSGNYILDEQLDLNEQYEFGDGVLVIESQDSRINDTYNEKLKMIKKQSKVDLPEYMESQQVKENYEKQKARESLNKTSKAMSLRQLFIDQYASLRDLDVKTKSYDVQNALLQSLTSGSLAATGINGDYIIDDQYHVTNIDSISKVFTPLIDMGTDSYRIAQQYMLLQMDYYNKVNDISYNTDTDDGYVNNIFPNKTTEDIQNDLAEIRESNPDLVSFVESDTMPKVRKIIRELNRMEIRAGVRNANTKVTVDFAKNEMGLDDAYINSNKTKNGYVTVDTLDYWSAANPWYIPISRETGITGTGTSMKSERNISKPKARKEGAEVYDIQPLADGFAEKYMSRINNIQQNKLRLAIANAMEKITGETSKPYTMKNGETGFITTTGDGQVQLRYLTNDNNGNLVNKVVAIDNYIADAYNGYQGLMQKLGIGNFTETMAGKGLKAISAARRAVLTKYNIPWQVKNVIVDFGDAIINNEFGIKGNALLIKNEMGAFLKDAKKNTSTYQEFMAFRGDYITKVQEKGYIQQDAKGLKGVLNKVDNVLQTGELMTRYAVYKTARQVGYSIADAQRLSNSATTDFYKTGSALKALDTTGATLFLGTSMAGTNRFYDSMIAPTVNAATLVYKTAKEQGVKAALNKSTYDAYDQRTLNRFIGQTIKMSLIFGLGRTMLKDLFKDKDKQEAIAGLSDSEIRDNICIPLGKDSILKIPKGRIWRSMDVIQDALTDSTIRDTDKMGVIDTFNYIIDNVGVNNLEDSLTMSSTIDIIKNRDYFGNEIYDANSKDKAKDIADYYAKQYGSWIYKAVKYINGGTDINPFISTFYTDTTTVSAYNNRFYNMKDAYENLAPKENGTFDDNDDMNNYFAWRVINYEKTNGELGKEIKILKSLKNDYTSSVDDIRKQEDKVKRLYNDIYNYIDSNTAYKYKDSNGKDIVRYGTNYRYTLEKKDDGTYSYTKSRK